MEAANFIEISIAIVGGDEQSAVVGNNPLLPLGNRSEVEFPCVPSGIEIISVEIAGSPPAFHTRISPSPIATTL